MNHLQIGDVVWVPHATEAWVYGTIIVKENKSIVAKTSDGDEVTVNKNELHLVEKCGRHLDLDVENLVELEELSEGAILHHVRKRFRKKAIYTHVGAILVAVNPFEWLDIYQKSHMMKAMNNIHLNPFPHVFFTAAVAFNQLRRNRSNQSVLISGESGAGKTETTKKVLSFLATMAPSAKSLKNNSKTTSKTSSKTTGSTNVEEVGIEEKILQSNPLLESLGNAKTLRNDNSSRFGKWMKVGFNSDSAIHGCEIVNYLLEKSRVVWQTKGERNYHIFYFLLAGADESLQRRLCISDTTPANYHYLNTSGCVSVAGIDDKDSFIEVIDALNTMQCSADFIWNLLSLVSATLHLGNVIFHRVQSSGGNDEAHIDRESFKHVNYIAKLLCVDKEELKFCLSEKSVKMGKDTTNIKFTPEQAVDSRDTVAKTIYSKLFDNVVGTINQLLGGAMITATEEEKKKHLVIGILDIFGFEVFDTNSFEQMCINYSNEKLQLHFNEVIFESEMKLYESEGIPTDRVEFLDNSGCVELIEGKPIGVIALLEDECALGSGNDISFLNKVSKAFNTTKSPQTAKASMFFVRDMEADNLFSVKHFAGAVKYTVDNFLEKNKDTMSRSMKKCLSESTNPFISSMFLADIKTEEEASKHGRRKGKHTLGTQFRDSLIGLVDALRNTDPHFIRCIKPNHQKSPGLLDGPLSLRQLRYAGLFEAIRIRKSGFAFRSNHDIFVRQYCIIQDEVFRLFVPSAKSKKSFLKDKMPKFMKDMQDSDFNSDSEDDDDVSVSKSKASSKQSKQSSKAEKGLDHTALAIKLLETAGRLGIVDGDTAHVGTTKVFIKENRQVMALDRRVAALNEKYRIILQSWFRMVTMRCKYYTVLYEVRMRSRYLAAQKRLEARQEAIRAAEKEAAKRAELQRRRVAIVHMQRWLRGCHLRLQVRKLTSLIRLRRMMECNDKDGILACTKDMRLSRLLDNISKFRNMGSVFARFKREVSFAKQLIKLLDAQDLCLKKLREATIHFDLQSLQQWLQEANNLKINLNLPIVSAAERCRIRLQAKKNIMSEMVTYLQNELENFSKFFRRKSVIFVPNISIAHSSNTNSVGTRENEGYENNESNIITSASTSTSTTNINHRNSQLHQGMKRDAAIALTLELEASEMSYDVLGYSEDLIFDARRLGIDTDLTNRLERQVKVTHRLVVARDLLRRAITTVNEFDIHRGMRLIVHIRKQSDSHNFADYEIRAAIHLLKLIAVEEELYPESKGIFLKFDDAALDSKFEERVFATLDSVYDRLVPLKINHHRDIIPRVQKDRMPPLLLALLEYCLHGEGDESLLTELGIDKNNGRPNLKATSTTTWLDHSSSSKSSSKNNSPDKKSQGNLNIFSTTSTTSKRELFKFIMTHVANHDTLRELFTPESVRKLDPYSSDEGWSGGNGLDALDDMNSVISGISGGTDMTDSNATFDKDGHIQAASSHRLSSKNPLVAKALEAKKLKAEKNLKSGKVWTSDHFEMSLRYFKWSKALSLWDSTSSNNIGNTVAHMNEIVDSNVQETASVASSYSRSPSIVAFGSSRSSPNYMKAIHNTSPHSNTSNSGSKIYKGNSTSSNTNNNRNSSSNSSESPSKKTTTTTNTTTTPSRDRREIFGFKIGPSRARCVDIINHATANEPLLYSNNGHSGIGGDASISSNNNVRRNKMVDAQDVSDHSSQYSSPSKKNYTISSNSSTISSLTSPTTNTAINNIMNINNISEIGTSKNPNFQNSFRFVGLGYVNTKLPGEESLDGLVQRCFQELEIGSVNYSLQASSSLGSN